MPGGSGFFRIRDRNGPAFRTRGYRSLGFYDLHLREGIQ